MIDDYTWRLLDDPAYRRMKELAADDPRIQLRGNPAYQDALRQLNDPVLQQAAQHFRQMADLTRQIQQSRYSGGPEPKAAPKPPHPGIAVKALRKKRGWSQGKLATQSNVSLRTISDLERMRRIPKPTTLADLMKGFEKPDS